MSDMERLAKLGKLEREIYELLCIRYKCMACAFNSMVWRPEDTIQEAIALARVELCLDYSCHLHMFRGGVDRQARKAS